MFAWLAFLDLVLVSVPIAVGEETPGGKGMTEANKERLVLDDMEDVADWGNGSPDETTLSASARHVKEGRKALLFANLVDHTKGEKNYPIGWPRTGKDLGSGDATDWSGYDFFECWIYAETSRQALPKEPIGVGFYHSGPKRSSHFPLPDVAKDQWAKVVIPVDRIMAPKDVRRVQFNISESNYKHGDRVDFYIDEVALTRFVDPAIVEVALERKILYPQDRVLRARYKLVGYKDLETTAVELALGRDGGPAAARVRGKAARTGEIVLPLDQPLAAGTYQATLGVRDARGGLIDRKTVELRVIPGPFCGTKAATDGTRKRGSDGVGAQRDHGADHRRGAGGLPCARIYDISRHVFREVLQVLLIVGDNRNHPLAPSRLRAMLHGRRFTCQPGHRLVVFCDHDYISRLEPLDQLRQSRLRLLNGNGCEGLFSSLLPSSDSCLLRVFAMFAFFRRPQAGRLLVLVNGDFLDAIIFPDNDWSAGLFHNLNHCAR